MTDKKENSTKVICLTIPSLGPGGMERVMAELANFFSTVPETVVHLVLYGIDRKIFYSLNDRVIIHTPPFQFVNSTRTLSTLKTLFFLRNTIKGVKPTTILSFGEYWNSFVLLALYGLKFPIYISDRCQPDKNLGKIHMILREWLYPRAKGIIAQTEKAKDIYHGYFPKSNIKVIGNPIREIKSINIIEKENIILTVGRLIKSKNHDKLIEIFARINNSNWKLIILGGDAQKQKNMSRLKELVRTLEVENNVILAGNISNVEPYYLKSKIFAFTSSSEGFPNVIGEAQSAGLPTIAFDCIAGPSDMIEDGKNGYLIPLFEYSTYENKLKELMKNEELRRNFGENAKRSVRKFSIDAVGKRFYEFILK